MLCVCVCACLCVCVCVNMSFLEVLKRGRFNLYMYAYLTVCHCFEGIKAAVADGRRPKPGPLLKCSSLTAHNGWQHPYATLAHSH